MNSEISTSSNRSFGIDKLNVKKAKISAITHVDCSARVQTVNKNISPIYHKLISKFKDKTGCPILENTSFNVRGDPIVNTPEDTFRCFMGANLDKIIIGNFYLDKNKQEKSLIKGYKN